MHDFQDREQGWRRALEWLAMITTGCTLAAVAYYAATKDVSLDGPRFNWGMFVFVTLIEYGSLIADRRGLWRYGWFKREMLAFLTAHVLVTVCYLVLSLPAPILFMLVGFSIEAIAIALVIEGQRKKYLHQQS